MSRQSSLTIAGYVLAGLACIAITGAIVLKLFFFNFLIVPQDGMYPGIPAGSIFFTKRKPYGNVADVKRGDVVVFTRMEKGNNYKFVWRVVGLPGDNVEVSSDSVLINGQELKHDQLRKEGNFLIYRELNGNVSYEVAYDQSAKRYPSKTSIDVPPNHVFVLGDNRYEAMDSTYFGPIPFESITEKKMF